MFVSILISNTTTELTFITKLYCISGFFSGSKFWRKMALASLEGVFNFYRVRLLLLKVFSMEKYNEVYFSLCHFLAILWRLRTQQKFNPHIKFLRKPVGDTNGI